MKEYSHEFAEHWYHTPSPVEKKGGIWTIRAGENKAKANYKIGPRIITYYSVHFVLEGEGQFSQNETNKQISQGDIFCLLPNQTHEYSTNPDNLLKMFWLAFDGKQAAAILNSIGITNYSTHIRNILNSESIEIINELKSYFQKDEEEFALQGLSILFKLFHHLSLQSKAINHVTKRPINWVQKSKEYMDIHYAENISINDVSKYIGFHRSHLTASFANEYGMTPNKYLLSLKMKQSLHLISRTNLTITEIALSLGYSDLYSFSRAFKNYFKVSPSQYIEEHSIKSREILKKT